MWRDYPSLGTEDHVDDDKDHHHHDDDAGGGVTLVTALGRRRGGPPGHRSVLPDIDVLPGSQ